MSTESPEIADPTGPPGGDIPTGDGPPGADAPPPGRPPLSRRKLALVVALTVAVVGLAVMAFLVGRSVPGKAKVKTVDPAAEAAKVPFVRYRDEEAGFSIEHPKNWAKVAEPSGERRLVLSDGELDSLLVRVTTTQEPTTPENLSNIKAYTDALVMAPDVKIFQQRSVKVGGMPGYYYVYNFREPETGVDGVHAHYFLFQGRKMTSLVFQALPSGNFKALAPIFDRMAESFVADPLPPGATTPPAVTPPPPPPASPP